LSLWDKKVKTIGEYLYLIGAVAMVIIYTGIKLSFSRKAYTEPDIFFLAYWLTHCIQQIKHSFMIIIKIVAHIQLFR